MSGPCIVCPRAWFLWVTYLQSPGDETHSEERRAIVHSARATGDVPSDLWQLWPKFLLPWFSWKPPVLPSCDPNLSHCFSVADISYWLTLPPARNSGFFFNPFSLGGCFIHCCCGGLSHSISVQTSLTMGPYKRSSRIFSPHIPRSPLILEHGEPWGLGMPRKTKQKHTTWGRRGQCLPSKC